MIHRIDIEGYKSIQKAEVNLRRLNIIIGSNGVGKSNFISAFKLIKDIYNKSLQNAVLTSGGADGVLYLGRKVTSRMWLDLYLGQDKSETANNRFIVDLRETDDKLYIYSMQTAFLSGVWHYQNCDSNVWESKFQYDRSGQAYYVNPIINSLDVYHFHDTGATSALKKQAYISDNQRLRPNGANLPSMLYLLKQKAPEVFRDIEALVSHVYPLFNAFVLEPERLAEDQIKLHWLQSGTPDYLFNASQLSDGTLRFIALATLLLQPDLKGTVIIDEPELGLHPKAISILSGLIKKVSEKVQIIISTQSVDLINDFTPEDILVAYRKGNGTDFKRLSTSELAEWLDEYTLGEMWIKNVFGD